MFLTLREKKSYHVFFQNTGLPPKANGRVNRCPGKGCVSFTHRGQTKASVWFSQKPVWNLVHHWEEHGLDHILSQPCLLRHVHFTTQRTETRGSSSTNSFVCLSVLECLPPLWVFVNTRAGKMALTDLLHDPTWLCYYDLSCFKKKNIYLKLTALSLMTFKYFWTNESTVTKLKLFWLLLQLSYSFVYTGPNSIILGFRSAASQDAVEGFESLDWRKGKFSDPIFFFFIGKCLATAEQDGRAPFKSFLPTGCEKS